VLLLYVPYLIEVLYIALLFSVFGLVFYPANLLIFALALFIYFKFQSLPLILFGAAAVLVGLCALLWIGISPDNLYPTGTQTFVSSIYTVGLGGIVVGIIKLALKRRSK
jgi:hypothetical protein